MSDQSQRLSCGSVMMRNTRIKYDRLKDELSVEAKNTGETVRALPAASAQSVTDVIGTIYNTADSLEGQDAVQQLLFILSAAVMREQAVGQLVEQNTELRDENIRLLRRLKELEHTAGSQLLGLH